MLRTSLHRTDASALAPRRGCRTGGIPVRLLAAAATLLVCGCLTAAAHAAPATCRAVAHPNEVQNTPGRLWVWSCLPKLSGQLEHYYPGDGPMGDIQGAQE